MLISFSFENWKSFRKGNYFSMIATHDSSHAERVPRLARYGVNILPIAAIYGGNATGKSNFCDALKFAGTMVVDGVREGKPIPTEPFRLDAESRARPSRFAFRILAGNCLYDYNFSVTGNVIAEERLAKVHKIGEHMLFHRRRGEKIRLDGVKNGKLRLQYAYRGTGANQLFLTNSVQQKVENDDYASVYRWFEDTIRFLSVDARMKNTSALIYEKNLIGNMLKSLDTGISRLHMEEVSFETFLTQEEKKLVKKNLREGSTVLLYRKHDRIFLECDKGRYVARKLMTGHVDSNGSPVIFDLSRESGGSRRLMDLIPSFIELFNRNSRCVYIVDEIDRSLHTMLTKELIVTFLNSCSRRTRNQLILTTHDVMLMDRRILRSDEIHVLERDWSGLTSVGSLGEFGDIDKIVDLRKSYLRGHFGGLPTILPDLSS